MFLENHKSAPTRDRFPELRVPPGPQTHGLQSPTQPKHPPCSLTTQTQEWSCQLLKFPPGDCVMRLGFLKKPLPESTGTMFSTRPGLKLKCGAEMCGMARPCCLLLTVELGHNEGPCGQLTLRSTAHGVWHPGGLRSSPPLLREPGERGCFALSPSHLSPLQASGLEQSRSKTPCEPARSCRGEHRAAQKLPCSPATRRSGSASPPSPAMENPAPSAPLPPLGYQTFTGERNLKFSTSLPASTSALGAITPKAQPPPAPRGDAAGSPGPPAPGYTVTCCSGSQLHLSLLHIPPLLPPLPRNLCHLLSDNRGERHRDERAQRGDPRAGVPGGLCLPLLSVLRAGQARRRAGREKELVCRSMAAGFN